MVGERFRLCLVVVRGDIGVEVEMVLRWRLMVRSLGETSLP